MVDNNLKVEKIIKRGLDIEQLKKLLLTPQQLMLFKYYFKHINFENYNQTYSFLMKFIRDGLDADKEEFEKNEKEIFKGKINKIMYEDFMSTYNF